MGKNLIKLTGFRFTDETLIPKIDIIARNEKRNRNQHVEYILTQYVQAYENQHGEIQLEE